MNSKEEKVYLNSCQLYLQSLFLRRRGFIYFVWKRGKKHIQSLKYQPKNDYYSIKQTLTLTLKVYVRGHTVLERNTYLYLLDSEGRQIDRLTIRVDLWGNEMKPYQLSIGGGKLLIKGRRKQVTQLEDFKKFRTQIEQSSEQDIPERDITKNYANEQQIDILSQEVDKIKKELQDNIYLNNKLKNDRSVLISKVKDLEYEHSQAMKRISNQINSLKSYYQQKIEIRESIYEDEIQKMVMQFNENIVLNKQMLEKITKHNIRYAQQLNDQREKNKKSIAQLKSEHSKKIQQMMRNHSEACTTFELEANDLKDQLQQIKSQIQEKNNNIETLNKRLKENQAFIKQQQQTLLKETKKFQEQIDFKEQTFLKIQEKLQQAKLTIMQLQGQLGAKKGIIDVYEQQNKENQRLLQKLRLDLEQQTKRVMKMDTEKFKIQCQFQKVQQQLEEKTNELQFNQKLLQDNKIQMIKRDQQFASQIKRYEQMYQQKNLMMNEELTRAHENIRDIQTIKYQQQAIITRLEEDLLMKDMDIEKVQIQLDRVSKFRESLEQTNENLISDITEYMKQKAYLLEENQKLQKQFIRFKNQYQNTEERYSNDLKEIHASYNQLIQKNAQLYKDQIKQLKEQLHKEVQFQNSMKQSFEKSAQKNFDLTVQENNKKVEEIKKMLSVQSARNQQYEAQVLSTKKKNIELQGQVRLLQTQLQNTKELLKQIQKEKQREIQMLNGRYQQMKISLNKANEKSINFQIQNPHKFASQKSQRKNQQLQQSIIVEKKSYQNKGIKSRKSLYSQLDQQNQSQLSQTPLSIISSQKVAQVKQDLKQVKQSVKQQIHQNRNSTTISIKKFKQLEEKLKYFEKALAEKQQNFQVQVQRFEEVARLNEDRIQMLEQQLEKIKELIKNSGQKQLLQEIKRFQNSFGEKRRSILKKSNNNILGSITQKISTGTQVQLIIAQQYDKLVKIVQNKQKGGQPSNGFGAAQFFSQSQQNMQMQRQQTSQNQNQFQNPNSKILTQNADQIRILQQKLMNTQMQLNRMKAQSQMTSSNIHKVIEIEKRQKQVQIRKKQAEDTFQRQRKNLKNQLQNERDQKQKIKNEKQRIINDLQEQLRKLKAKLSEIQDRKKSSGPDFYMQYQSEMEENNRKIMQMSRSLNQAKLQAENNEDQLRMVKKKLTDTTKAIAQAQQKINLLEKRSQQSKRTQNKLKRQIEQKQDQVSKNAHELKINKEQVHRYMSLNSQLTMQKKLLYDEKTQLDDIINRKDQQILKLQKDLDRFRARAEKTEDATQEKKNQLRKEIQKLEMQVVKLEKKVIQDEQIINSFKNKLDTSQKEKKKLVQEKVQSYTEKLNIYVEEISNIKEMLNQNQNEISRLKIQNSELFDQNQMINTTYGKLQAKLEQQMQNVQQLLNQNAKLKDQSHRYREGFQKYQYENEKLQNVLEVQKKQFQEQKLLLSKKNQKLEFMEEANEKYVYEIKSLRMKINQRHIDAEALNKLTDKYNLQEQRNQELSLNLQTLESEYLNYKKKYRFTEEQIHQTIDNLTNNFKEQLEIQLDNLTKELTDKHNARIKQLQDEILQMFNENAKMRLQIQHLNDENSDLKLSVYQLQQAQQKIDQLSQNNHALSQALLNLKNNGSVNEEKAKKTENDLRNAQVKIEKMVGELDLIKTKNEQLTEKNKALNQHLKQLQALQQNTTDKYNLLHAEKEIMIQNLKSDIQVLQNKLMASQLQVNRIKESQANISEAYSAKVKKLQKKLSQMSEAMAQHQNLLESQFNSQMNSMQMQLMKINDQLIEKSNKVTELEMALDQAQIQIQDLGKQLANARFKANDEIQLWQEEMNKLRQQMKQTDQAYNSNIKQLEDQLASMSKQLTLARLNRSNIGGSRLRGSQVQQRLTKRNQQKIKVKDKKIEQLKTTIYNLQENIMKIKKKEASENIVTDYEKLKTEHNQLMRQYRNVISSKDSQIQKLTQQVRTYKREVLQTKQRQENLLLQQDEKDLEIDSLTCQLKTTKQLYQQMQKELNKRKALLSQHLSDKENQTRLSQALQQIGTHEKTIEELNKTIDNLRSQNKKKTLQTKKLQDQIKRLQDLQNLMKNQKSKNTNDIGQLKNQLKQKTVLVEQFKADINKLQLQNNQLNTQIFQLQTQKALLQQKIQSQAQKIQEHIIKINQYMLSVRQYNQIKQQCSMNYGKSVQAVIQGGPWIEELQKRQIQLDQLSKQLQQMKFLHQRNLLDYEQLKKQNYEMEIRMQDNNILHDQLDDLRKICDKLQEEKQAAVFKEQAIRVQLDNILDSENVKDIKGRIRQVLRKSYRAY